KLELDSTDVRILNSLAEGEKSLSTIREELSLPKTTAWRRVRRLEGKGLVEVERTRSGSLIRLSKLGRDVLKDREKRY
ncbi:MAG: helix-turn-helix domain-containing protein, partial [Candidatus Korarchaeota archaeon]|nr:helix-turn-helix domain-containing protein [Candidatus Korarchaeota archaeon]